MEWLRAPSLAMSLFCLPSTHRYFMLHSHHKHDSLSNYCHLIMLQEYDCTMTWLVGAACNVASHGAHLADALLFAPPPTPPLVRVRG